MNRLRGRWPDLLLGGILLGIALTPWLLAFGLGVLVGVGL